MIFRPIFLLLQFVSATTWQHRFVCQYIDADGAIQMCEKLQQCHYCTRVNDMWIEIQLLAGGTARLWPLYVHNLFRCTKLTSVQACQLSAFIVINRLDVKIIETWFGLMGTRQSDRALVIKLISQLITNPEYYAFVFGFSVRQLVHKYVYGFQEVQFRQTTKGMYNRYISSVYVVNYFIGPVVS